MKCLFYEQNKFTLTTATEIFSLISQQSLWRCFVCFGSKPAVFVTLTGSFNLSVLLQLKSIFLPFLTAPVTEPVLSLHVRGSWHIYYVIPQPTFAKYFTWAGTVRVSYVVKLFQLGTHKYLGLIVSWSLTPIRCPLTNKVNGEEIKLF